MFDIYSSRSYSEQMGKPMYRDQGYVFDIPLETLMDKNFKYKLSDWIHVAKKEKIGNTTKDDVAEDFEVNSFETDAEEEYIDTLSEVEKNNTNRKEETSDDDSEENDGDPELESFDTEGE